MNTDTDTVGPAYFSIEVLPQHVLDGIGRNCHHWTPEDRVDLQAELFRLREALGVDRLERDEA